MLALRRASLSLRIRGLRIRGFAATFPDLEQQELNHDEVLEFPVVASDKCACFKGFYCTKHASSNPFLGGRRNFSSRAGANKRGVKEEKDDSESEFSDVETDSEDELTSKVDLSEVDYDDGDGDADADADAEGEADLIERVPSQKRAALGLVDAMLNTRDLSMKEILNKWVEEGNQLNRSEAYSAMLTFRKMKMYGKALQLMEWLEENKQYEFAERDYSSHLDFIAKVRGLHIAERYIERIPQLFRGELVYRTLLANCVLANNLQKAEQVFNKMKDLEFPLTVFTCNQLILLYKRVDKKKIADVLLLMEKENLKPSLFTYKMLIDTKGRCNDIEGMEAILDAMKNEGVELDTHAKLIVAGFYASDGLKEKAEAILKEFEGGDLKENFRQNFIKLLEIYAELGQADKVGQVWKFCEANPKAWECIAAIRAWGKLKRIEEAEAIFEQMLKTVKKPSSTHFNSLLRVYADNKMLAKGKDLVKRMMGSSFKVDAITWDSIVKLFLDAGELEKANAVLAKASQMKLSKPILYRSYMAVMDKYSERGDVHNSEKLFLRMRQAGYTSRYTQFQILIQAYVNAKAPAYGMRERMIADSVFPNRTIAAQLVKIDAFRESELSDFLD